MANCGVILCVRRTDGGNGGHDFTQLQLVEDGGLSGSVQADHQNSHLLLAPEAIEQLREGQTHVGGIWRVCGVRFGVG